MNTDPYLYQPREVSIETLALCNAACTFCPYPTLERKREKLSDETLDNLIKQMSSWRHPFTISPFKVNEPFLDVRLTEFCRQINERLPLASLRLFTNGSRFTRDIMCEVFALKRVQHIWVSLNEVDEAAYKSTMGLNFDHTAGRIDLLHAMWKPRPRQTIVISRVSEVDPTLERAKRAAFDFYVYNRWPGVVTVHIKRDGWLGYTEPSNPEIPQRPCGRWWELSITATGDCALCCMDGTGEFKVGNVHELSLIDIYNQPKLLNMRMHAQRRNGINPCERCTYG